VLVSLKLSLYVEIKFCMYFVDLIAINLVSWKVIMASSIMEYFISSCKLSWAVLREETFHSVYYLAFIVYSGLSVCFLC
jgi:hypothetical protein